MKITLFQSLLLLANVATFVRAEECVQLGSFDLNPIAGSGLNQDYAPTTSLPFSTAGNTICEFFLKSNCRSNGNIRSAPTCDWEIDIAFNKGEACDASRASRRSGKIFVSGTGPAVYDITRGEGDFTGISGKIDSELVLSNFNLSNWKTVGSMCYDNVGGTDIETGGCCSWNVPYDCGASPWCDGSRNRCENNCNGIYIDPTNPPQPKGCCSWNGATCGADNWCNFSEDRCEGPCIGQYI